MQVTKMSAQRDERAGMGRKATMVSGSAQADATTGVAIVSAASASTDIAWANALVM